MKKLFTTLFVTITFALLFSYTNVTSERNFPPIVKTGAPGDGFCTDCHGGYPLNGGPGGVTVTFGDTSNTYKPGVKYVITVTVFDSLQSRFGFETLALTPSLVQAGRPKVMDAANTRVRTDKQTGRTYVSNFLGSGLNSWQYKWTAPATNVGPITFYATGNAANWDATEYGDHIYTNTLVINPEGSPKTQESSAEHKELSMYPNPVTKNFSVHYSINERANVSLRLFDVSGKLIQQFIEGIEDEGMHQRSLQLNNEVTSGLYLLVLQSGSVIETQKLVVK